MKVITKRVQRGVGQGGFHTSSIILKGDNFLFGTDFPFEFVYDCGTNSLGPSGLNIASFLRQHIGLYEPAGVIVDALFISHLDKDHYNGAEQLCNAKKVDRIFLPYFTIEELIFLISNQLSAGIAVSAAFATSMASIAKGARKLFNVPVTVVGGTTSNPPDPIQPTSLANNGRLRAVLLGEDGNIYPIGDNIPAGASIGLVVDKKPIPWILRPWSYKQNATAKKNHETSNIEHARSEEYLRPVEWDIRRRHRKYRKKQG